MNEVTDILDLRLGRVGNTHGGSWLAWNASGSAAPTCASMPFNPCQSIPNAATCNAAQLVILLQLLSAPAAPSLVNAGLLTRGAHPAWEGSAGPMRSCPTQSMYNSTRISTHSLGMCQAAMLRVAAAEMAGPQLAAADVSSHMSLALIGDMAKMAAVLVAAVPGADIYGQLLHAGLWCAPRVLQEQQPLLAKPWAGGAGAASCGAGHTSLVGDSIITGTPLSIVPSYHLENLTHLFFMLDSGHRMT